MNVRGIRYWLILPLLILSLMLAACEPAAEDEGLEPGVEPGVEEPVEEQPLEEEPLEEEPLEEEPVEPGVGVGEGPLLIQSSTLVGMPVALGEEALADDEVLDAEATTEVSDILVAPDGTIAFVVLDSGTFLGEGEGLEGQVALPWSAFTADPANERLLLTAPAADLQTMVTPFNTEAFAEDDGLIESEEAQAAGLGTEFEGLVRMGGAFRDFEIVSTVTGEDMGEVEQAILDLQAGQAVFAVADFGGFLGLAEHTVAVPWEQLQIAPTQADETGATFALAATEETIENAPEFDESAWTFWPNVGEEGVIEENQAFWETAG